MGRPAGGTNCPRPAWRGMVPTKWGAGLGHDFLRNIERTRVIVHLLDARPQDESNPAENYRLIREELKRYSPELADKPELVVLNKADLFEDADERAALAKELAREL